MASVTINGVSKCTQRNLVKSILMGACLSLCYAAGPATDEETRAFEDMYESYSGRQRRRGRAQAHCLADLKKTPDALYEWMISNEKYNNRLVHNSIDPTFTKTYEDWKASKRQEFCRNLNEKIKYSYQKGSSKFFISLFRKAIESEFINHNAEPSRTVSENVMIGGKKVTQNVEKSGLEFSLLNGKVRDSYVLSLNMLDAYWDAKIRVEVPCAKEISQAQEVGAFKKILKRRQLEIALTKPNEVSSNSAWVPAEIVGFHGEDTICIRYKVSRSGGFENEKICVSNRDHRIRVRGAVKNPEKLFDLMPNFWERIQEWERKSQGYLDLQSYKRGIDWSSAFRYYGSNMRKAASELRKEYSTAKDGSKTLAKCLGFGLSREEKAKMAQVRMEMDEKWHHHVKENNLGELMHNAETLIKRWGTAGPDVKSQIKEELKKIHGSLQSLGYWKDSKGTLHKVFREPELIEVTEAMETHVKALVVAMEKDFVSSSKLKSEEAKIMTGCIHHLAHFVQNYHTKYPEKLDPATALLYMRRYSTFGVNYPKILTIKTGPDGWTPNQNIITEVLKSIAGIPGQLGFQGSKKTTKCPVPVKDGMPQPEFSQYGVRNCTWVNCHIAMTRAIQHLFPSGDHFTLREVATAYPVPPEHSRSTTCNMSVTERPPTPEDQMVQEQGPLTKEELKLERLDDCKV